MSENVYLEGFHVDRVSREKLLGQSARVLWFTGLSGSGKSTVANALEIELNKKGKLTYILDGDNIRLTLNKDLGFTNDDRRENIRRIGCLANILLNTGVITLCTFVSPLREDRENVRELIGKDFIEVYVKCSIDECEKRDPKNLYKRARNGEIKNFTGIDSPYEAPISPEITIDTSVLSIEESVKTIIDYLDIE